MRPPVPVQSWTTGGTVPQLFPGLLGHLETMCSLTCRLGESAVAWLCPAAVGRRQAYHNHPQLLHCGADCRQSAAPSIYISGAQACNARDQCYTCWPGTGCEPLKEYNRLVVREHGRLHGRHAMKAEARPFPRATSHLALVGLCRRLGVN